MKLYVIRHGLSMANADGVIQGHANSNLSDVGEKQADLLGRYFNAEGVSPEVIYSSPLERAHATARTIAHRLDPSPPVVTIDELKEVDVGTLSGLSLDDAYEMYPTRWAPDVNKWLDFSGFGGESFDEFFKRVGDAVRKLMDEWEDPLADRTIFFTAHAGTMRPLLKTLLDATGDFMFFTFGNCCHVVIEYREVRGSIRRVLSEFMRIETVAELMGEENPAEGTEDTVGKKIG
jgi:alpha-ribazole phosphatase